MVSLSVHVWSFPEDIFFTFTCHQSYNVSTEVYVGMTERALA